MSLSNSVHPKAVALLASAVLQSGNLPPGTVCVLPGVPGSGTRPASASSGSDGGEESPYIRFMLGDKLVITNIYTDKAIFQESFNDYLSPSLIRVQHSFRYSRISSLAVDYAKSFIRSPLYELILSNTPDFWPY